MAGQPIIAELGLRTAEIGSAGTLVIGVGTNLGDANRVGFYSVITGTERLGIVVAGTDAVRVHNDAVDSMLDVQGPIATTKHINISDADGGHTPADGDIWYTGTLFQFRQNGSTVGLATAAPVQSVFGRVGDVTAVGGDYNASQIDNTSGVVGADVAAALDTLDASKLESVLSTNSVTGDGTLGTELQLVNDAASPGNNKAYGTNNIGTKGFFDSVSSAFGRTGAVVALASDYDASQVDNDSGVTGAFVDDALNTLDANKIESVLTANSVTGDGLSGTEVQLVNDVASPGANQVYGTNGAGTKGWKADPSAATPGGASTNVQFNNAGAFDGDAEFTWDTTNKVLAVSGNQTIAQGSLTDPEVGLAITATWNDGVDTFKAFTVDVTNTASAAASRLMELSAGGVAQFDVDATGAWTSSGGGSITLGSLVNPETALDITATWNDVADTFVGIRQDITNTGSAATSRLIQLQVGAADRFTVDTAGFGLFAAAIRIGTTADTTNGNIRYTGTDFEGRVGGSWLSLTNTPVNPGGADTNIQFNNAGAFDGDAELTWDTTNKVLALSGNQTIAQGTLTDPEIALAVTATWNDGVDTFNAIDVNVTDTASAAASRLLNLRVGGTTVFEVDKAGNVDISGKLTVAGLIDPTGMVFDEQATVPGGAPGAAKGTVWVRNDTPNVLMFTDDVGTDTVLSTGGSPTHTESFVNGDLVSGVLTVTHSLGNQYVHVTVSDNSDIMIEPDSITFTDSNNLDIDLSSFGTLTGTWNVVVGP